MLEVFSWVGILFVFVSYLTIVLGASVEIKAFGLRNVDWPIIVIATVFAPITIFYMAITNIVNMGISDNWI